MLVYKHRGVFVFIWTNEMLDQQIFLISRRVLPVFADVTLFIA